MLRHSDLPHTGMRRPHRERSGIAQYLRRDSGSAYAWIPSNEIPPRAPRAARQVRTRLGWSSWDALVMILCGIAHAIIGFMNQPRSP
jgi:hypothetical protein